MLKVHHARRARSVRVLWLLEELEVPYAIEPIEFRPEALRSAEYLQVHPLGQVPVVELVETHTRIFESGAILQYLLEQHDREGRLAPKPGSAQRAEFLQWFHFGEATLARYASEVIRHQYGQPAEERVPEVVGAMRRRYRKAVELVDRVLRDRAYILGAEFSAADIMVSYGISTTKIAAELPAELTHVAAYLKRLMERPAYRKAWQ